VMAVRNSGCCVMAVRNSGCCVMAGAQ